VLRVGVIMYQTSQTKGQELVAQRMVEELRRQGEDAFLITSVYDDWEPVISVEEVQQRGGFVTLFDERLGIPVIRVNSTLTSWPPRRISFVDFVATLTKLVDELKLNVLVTHSTLWNGPEEAARFVEWRRNLARNGAPFRRVVLCQMSHYQEPDADRYTVVERTYRETWNQVSLAQIVQDADLVLVTTPFETRSMEQLGAPPEKCILFPGGIVLPPERVGQTRSLFDRLRLAPETRLVTVLGTVEERKNDLGVLEVAKALAARKNLRFIIAGKLEGDYGQKVAEEAARLENVTLLGPVTEEEKGELIRRSYVNLTMSRSEALGLAQMEFMYAGVPVVTSGVGGQSWLVKDGSNGIVLDGPDDARGAAAAIELLLDHHAMRGRMGIKASESVRPYSMPALIHVLDRRLTAIVEGGGAHTPMQGAPDEKVIDSMVGTKERVIVTNRRLIMRSLAEDSEPTEIPFSEITRITLRKRHTWRVLIIGAAFTLLLLGAAVVLPPLGGSLPEPLGRLLVRPSGVTGGIALTAIIVAPLFASIASLLLTRKDEFRVHRSNASQVRIPGEFSRMVRAVDKLTPNELVEPPRRKR
jgi:D-inositol-3-phosphate glycosyltransferase